MTAVVSVTDRYPIASLARTEEAANGLAIVGGWLVGCLLLSARLFR